jgi:hypothetical protein
MKTLTALAFASLLLIAARLPAQTPPIAFGEPEFDPPNPATLHDGEFVYVRIRYQSSAPVRVGAEPYYAGRPAKGGRIDGDVGVPAGPGEVISWFSFRGIGRVDAVRLFAIPGGRSRISQDVPVSFTWDGQPSAGVTRAPWVSPLLKQEAQRRKAAFAEMETRFNSSMGSGGGGLAVVVFGMVFASVALAALIACIVWPLWGTVRWQGPWRAAAAGPLTAMALWIAKDVYDLSADRTSHNLLPFEFVIAAVAIAPYMLVVTLLRHVRLKHHKRHGPLS